MQTITHAHAWHRPHAEALIPRPTIYAQICIHIHIHMCINAQMYKYIHTRIYIHTYMSAHIHTYTYVHTHIKNVHMNARKHAWNDCAAANARGAVVERGSFARLFRSTQCHRKPHFAPPMQGLYCTHFLKYQYPSHPHPLFPTYPRTVRGLRAIAVVLFYTDQMNRVHSSEEALRSFTMAPCVVAERLKGNQRCSRAAVSEHAGIQAREWSRWLFTKKWEVNKKTTKPCNSPHTITARRSDNIPLICTGAGPIHPVHSQPMSLATEAMPETRLHFCHFPAVFWLFFFVLFLEQLRLPNTKRQHNHLGNPKLSLFTSQRPNVNNLTFLVPTYFVLWIVFSRRNVCVAGASWGRG